MRTVTIAGIGNLRTTKLRSKPPFPTFPRTCGTRAALRVTVRRMRSLSPAVHDPSQTCSHGSCAGNRETAKFIAAGGTSAAAPSFAAIMALVNQKLGSRQGQADYVLYRLAAVETLSKCNASTQSALPAASCIFNDVTAGNNAVPG